MTPPFTGNGRVTYTWLAGVLVSVLLLVGGAVVAHLLDDITELQQTVRVKAEESAATRAELNAVQAQLGRIENKLDRLLEAR